MSSAGRPVAGAERLPTPSCTEPERSFTRWQPLSVESCVMLILHELTAHR